MFDVLASLRGHTAAPKTIKAKQSRRKVKAATVKPVSNRWPADATSTLTASECDVRCGLDQDQLGKVHNIAPDGSVGVKMLDHPYAEDTLWWHPTEVVAITGVATSGTCASLWAALDASREHAAKAKAA